MYKRYRGRSWHVVFPDVRDFEIFDDLEPAEILNVVCDTWCSFPGRTAMCYFCMSTSGVYHLHCYFTDKIVFHPKVIRTLFPGVIAEPLRCSVYYFMLYMKKSTDDILDFCVGVSEDVI